MITISIDSDILKRIDARNATLPMYFSRNSFIVSLIRSELNRMDAFEDENERDVYTMSIVSDYVKVGRPKGDAKKVRRVEDGKVYSSVREAAKDVGVTYMAIYQAATGMIKTSARYHWEYVE